MKLVAFWLMLIYWLVLGIACQHAQQVDVAPPQDTWYVLEER